MLALLYLGEPCAQHVAAVFKVLEMAALHLTGHDYARRDMGKAHCRGGLVDLLAACAGGAEHVHLDILVAQLDLVIIVAYLRHDLDRSKGGVAAAGSVKRGNAH